MPAWTYSRSASSAITAIYLLAAALVQPARAQQCVEDVFDDSSYVVCTVDPATSDLQLFWRNAQGEPYRSFSNLAEALGDKRRELVFAVNAGMYRPDFTPVGLHVEHGRELRPADTTAVEGPPGQVPNFYKKPNGVFFLGQKRADILPTSAFLEAKPQARFASQSGPMLVIDNQLHPALIPGSTDKRRRSGVGVCRSGQVRFAISDGGVNFHDFARFFRDRLACPNALYLDGGRGVGLYSPQLGRNDFSWHGGYGPIFGLVE